MMIFMFCKSYKFGVYSKKTEKFLEYTPNESIYLLC